MKQYTIETPDGYKAVETKVDNGILIRFVEEEKYEPKKEKYEPKEGDICALDFKSSRGVKKLIFCLKSIRGRGCDSINYYFGINGGGDFNTGGYYGYYDKDIFRPATPEEQKQLFDALAKAGKMWNSDKKEIVDVPKLLVPDNIHIWRSKEDFGYDQLFIGFNGDKQLLGYNPKFKTWVVYPNHDGYERAKCELVEVKREELKDGDLVCDVGCGDDLRDYSILDSGVLVFSYGRYLNHTESIDKTKYKLIPLNG